MRKKRGFTLVELLAVIVILAIILMIAVPSIAGIIKSSTKGAFKSDARMVLQAIEYMKLENRNFNPQEVTKENISDLLELDNTNYEQVNISVNEGTISILIIGKDKWNGLTAYGTLKTMNVVGTEEYDAIPPSITIIGDNPINIGKGSIYVDQGATATDEKDGDVAITSIIIRDEHNEIVEEIDTSIFTTYTITYTAADSNGNTSTSVRRVNIIDATSPVVTVIGDNPATVNKGSSYSDQGATAIDETDGDITSNIVITGTVNPNVMGIYTITYTVSDSAGNVTVLTRTVNVVDQNAPVITLIGNSVITLYRTSTYVDAGATATDDVDGDITSNIISTGLVNTNVIGTYTITYNVADSSSNNALTVTRTINIISNTYTFNYIGDYQTFTAPEAGNYKIELWGSKGGGTGGGYGGYTSGNISLSKNEILYVYVGQEGLSGNRKDTSSTTSTSLQTFNGGGAGGLAGGPYLLEGTTYYYYFGDAGGGATDIRLVNGPWNDASSLRSRIMVASAGGGNNSGTTMKKGGAHAGGISGYNGDTFDPYPNSEGVGATQTSGNAFGIGGPGGNAPQTGGTGYGFCHGMNGGGGGYYGGTGGQSTGGSCYFMGGGGGSSFISGHTGCNAINSSGTHTGQANHYSGKVFINTQIIDGSGYNWTNTKGSQVQMPKPDGSLYNTGIGHTGNGVAKITYLP